jgi:hypothetical protein
LKQWIVLLCPLHSPKIEDKEGENKWGIGQINLSPIPLPWWYVMVWGHMKCQFKEKGYVAHCPRSKRKIDSC